MLAIRSLGSGRHRLMAAGLAAAVPLAIVGATAPPPASSLPGGGWSGLWLSTTSTAAGTSLADVRKIIAADTGAAATLTGSGVGIALIDTGVASVPGLPAANIVNGPDLSFESQSANLRYHDSYGHGTHLAGIMVANDTATGAKGIAPGAKVTSIKAGTANGAADVTQVIAAIDWVVKNRNHDPANPIRVLNLSYGSGGNPPAWSDPLQFAVEQAWKAGIVVVAAAGNQGNATGRLNNPANDLVVMAVGSTSTKGTIPVSDDTVSTFTNIHHQRPLDVVVPGESIASLRVEGSNIDNSYPGARVGTTLFKGSGTSQSAAVVSAAVALLLQYKPSLTPDLVRRYIEESRTWLPNGLEGAGSLNVNAAIAKINSTPNPYLPTRSYGAGDGPVHDARGISRAVSNGVELVGEKSIFGPWSSSTWAAKAKTQTTWAGGVWMGYRMAGDGWTGSSWASKTWAAGTWPGASWAGPANWTDPAWTGRYWSGRYWSAGAWTGRYWSSDDWETAYWG
ncbi:S8 family serine peptidase [Actinophytocola sp.]|uniref:S8 family serine peptidase n=1 Tax=Actinophytocola sp. TaxID=1872138 RepID=UPI002D80A5A6|nr:S8 family serine peptidase [Actinophytocola sp.]HET9141388.1 S8 family serine peptidase [Actinophytocola sp.]